MQTKTKLGKPRGTRKTILSDTEIEQIRNHYKTADISMTKLCIKYKIGFQRLRKIVEDIQPPEKIFNIGHQNIETTREDKIRAKNISRKMLWSKLKPGKYIKVLIDNELFKGKIQNHNNRYLNFYDEFRNRLTTINFSEYLTSEVKINMKFDDFCHVVEKKT